MEHNKFHATKSHAQGYTKRKKKKSGGPVASQSKGRNGSNLASKKKNGNLKTTKRKTKKNQEPAHLSLADAKTQYRSRQQQPESSRSNTEPPDLSAIQNQNHENVDTMDEPSAPSTLFARWRFNNKRNNAGNSTSNLAPPSFSAQQNHQQPGAFFVNGNNRQDDSDSSANGGYHDFHNSNTVQSGNPAGAADDGEEAPVVEAFLQEEDSRLFEQRRPPSMLSAAAPVPASALMVSEEEEPENPDEKSSEDDSTCCSLNLIFIIGLFLAVIIIVVTVVVIVVVTLGSSDTGNETLSSVPPISSTSPSTAPSMGLSYPLIFDRVNVNDYLYMGMAATQFGFDRSDCFSTTSTQDPHVVELTCPGSSAAIVLLRVIGYNALGVEQEGPPLDCETKSARSITCTYREIQTLEMAAQTTIFLTTCASDAYQNFEADVKVESKSIALSSCPENPAQFSHSLSVSVY